MNATISKAGSLGTHVMYTGRGSERKTGWIVQYLHPAGYQAYYWAPSLKLAKEWFAGKFGELA